MLWGRRRGRLGPDLEKGPSKPGKGERGRGEGGLGQGAREEAG